MGFNRLKINDTVFVIDAINNYFGRALLYKRVDTSLFAVLHLELPDGSIIKKVISKKMMGKCYYGHNIKLVTTSEKIFIRKLQDILPTLNRTLRKNRGQYGQKQKDA